MHDLVIRGGTVVDGSGKKRFSADIGIKDGKIAEIGRIAAGSGKRSLDADGLTSEVIIRQALQATVRR